MGKDKTPEWGLDAKLSRLDKSVAEGVKTILWTSSVVTSLLNDICPVDVPEELLPVLKDERPIYISAKRKALKYIEFVCAKVGAMLTAGIITPPTSAWSFSAIMANKKDGKRSFHVYYGILNRKMKADCFRLPMMQDIFVEL